MALQLHLVDATDVLFELLRTGQLTAQQVLIADGVDPLEAEHLDLVECKARPGVLAFLVESF